MSSPLVQDYHATEEGQKVVVQKEEAQPTASRKLLWIIGSVLAVMLIIGAAYSGKMNANTVTVPVQGQFQTMFMTAPKAVAPVFAVKQAVQSKAQVEAAMSIPSVAATEAVTELTPAVPEVYSSTPAPTWYSCPVHGYPPGYKACCKAFDRCTDLCYIWDCILQIQDCVTYYATCPPTPSPTA